MLLMLLCTVAVSSATSILWCSDSDTQDQGFVDLLIDEGYTVDRLPAANDMTQAKVDLANSYDLVIFGRHADSGGYDDGEEPALWNSITTPMLQQNAYLARNNRWSWLETGGTSNTSTNMALDLDSENPLYAILFNGVTLTQGGEVDYVSADTVALASTANAGNGILIGHRSYDPEPWVYAAYWEQGVEFYPGSGQYAAGPRLLLPADELVENLTANGVIMFLNMVYEMSGATFNRTPIADAGYDRIANVNETIKLDANIFDPDSAVTITWTQLSGPGTATFEDNSVEDPNVTFDTKGTYELEVSADDTTTVVTDQLTVYVRDSADNAMIAHWDFEGLPDPNTLTDVTGNGFTGILYKTDGGDPNVAAGNLFGGSQAADLRAGNTYWEIPNSYDNTDPNFNNLTTGMTAAAWVKNSDSSIGAPMIVGNGLDGWRLQVNVGSYNLACQPVGVDLFASGINPYDGVWHHVVGVYDGVASQALIYVDGLLVATDSVNPGSLFTKGEDYPLIQVANRGDADRPWKGYIDDIRIFNYPLTDVEIASLAGQGDLAVQVSAGDDQLIQYKGTPVQMDGTLLVNDGVPTAATLQWAVEIVPAGVDPNLVIFSDDTIEDPTVTFPNVDGLYTLSLTADDTVLPAIDYIDIDLVIPTCDDVIADGLGIAADISGPEDVSDCRVDIYDFAAMASDWLRCNDPSDAACEWAYQQ